MTFTEKNFFADTPAVFVQSPLHPQWYVNLLTGEYSENPKAVRGFCGKRKRDGRLYTPDGIAVDELVFSTALKRKISEYAILRHTDGDRTNNSLANLRMEKRPSFAQIRARSATSLFQPIEVTSNRGDRWCFLSKHTCSRFFDVSVSTVYKYVAGQRATPTRNTDFGQLTFRAMKESEVDNRTTFITFQNSRVPFRFRNQVVLATKTLRETRQTDSAEEPPYHSDSECD